MPDDFDKLVGRDRTRRSSFMVPVTGPLPVQVRHEIRAALEAHMKKRGLSQADLADAIGQSKTYISNLLNNAAALPEATRDQMLRDINNWLEREHRSEESQRPDDFVVVMTAIMERLYAVAENAAQRADMYVVTGPSGVGKTHGTEAIQAEIPTVIAMTAGHDTRTPNKLIRAIYAAATRRRRCDSTQLDLADVAEKLRMPGRVKTRSVLWIDDAQRLTGRCLTTLMELHNLAGCSIVLVGTRDLRSMVSTDDSPELGQLSSRIGLRVDLAPEIRGALCGGGQRAAKCFTVADIRKLFARSKLKLHSDAARMLCEMANTRRGTLRRVMRVFDWAEVAAREAGADTITVEHLRAAASLVEEEQELPTLASEELAEAAATA